MDGPTVDGNDTGNVTDTSNAPSIPIIVLHLHYLQQCCHFKLFYITSTVCCNCVCRFQFSQKSGSTTPEEQDNQLSK